MHSFRATSWTRFATTIKMRSCKCCRNSLSHVCWVALLDSPYSQPFCPYICMYVCLSVCKIFCLIWIENGSVDFDKIRQEGVFYALVLRVRKLASMPLRCLATRRKTSKIGSTCRTLMACSHRRQDSFVSSASAV